MSDLTLYEFVDGLSPTDQSEALDLVSEASYSMDRNEWATLLQKPLAEAVHRLCESILFGVWLDVLDIDAAPSADDELLSEFEHGREDGLVDKSIDFETFRAQQLDALHQRRKDIDAYHIGLRQLEAALGKCGIEVALDQPLGLAEYCLAHGIAKEVSDNRLLFAAPPPLP
jgi:hypothetical protein